MEHCLLAISRVATWHWVKNVAWATDPNTSRLSLVQVEALANQKCSQNHQLTIPKCKNIQTIEVYSRYDVLYISPLCNGLKQNHKVFFFEFWLNYSIFMSGRVVKLTEEELDCIGFCFTMVSSSVNHTLLQQFSTKLLFNTSLQHSSPTLLFDALSDLLLPQPSSPTLVYNIASRR